MARADDQNDRIACGAKTRAGTPCRRPPCIGRERCSKHGGRSLIGPAHDRWKDGRRSKLLHGLGLGASFDAALSDCDLISLRDHLAVCEAKIDALFAELIGAQSAAADEALTDAIVALEAAIVGGDTERREAAVAGVKDAAAAFTRRPQALWDEVQGWIEQRRKLSDTHSKVAERAARVLTSDQVAGIITALIHSVAKHVVDRGQLAAIGQDMRRLAGDQTRIVH